MQPVGFPVSSLPAPEGAYIDSDLPGEARLRGGVSELNRNANFLPRLGASLLRMIRIVAPGAEQRMFGGTLRVGRLS